MIETIVELAALRERIGEWKRAGLRVGFVPTMGNLHAGHHSLVALARRHCDRVVASVFVNPTQFGPNEDFTRYPRTPDADAAGLAAAGCHLLWMPDVATMYPFGPDGAVRGCRRRAGASGRPRRGRLACAPAPAGARPRGGRRARARVRAPRGGARGRGRGGRPSRPAAPAAPRPFQPTSLPQELDPCL